jgi:plastocyanin
MKKGTTPHFWLRLIGTAVFSFLGAATSPAATKHIIQFGGSLGFAYSPSSLSVTVGDTIVWSGDFTAHPLSSTTIPAGALSWHNGTGTVFDYVVTVPGTYNYQCDSHSELGMVGSFDAAVTSVDNGQNFKLPASFQLLQNYPNPSNPSTTIKYELPKASQVSLTVYDILGRVVSVLVNEKKEAGVYEVKFDASGLSSGVYFYRLIAGSNVQTRKLMLLR